MNLQTFLELARQSLGLDRKFFKYSKWDYAKKMRFCLLKYALIAKHAFKKFKLGEDRVDFDGEDIYYDSRFGLAGYQSMLARHQYLIKNVAHIGNVKTIVDVGANVGFFSKLCRDIYPNSTIFSFEPIPKTFFCLKENFQNDKKTHTFNLALSDHIGSTKMQFDENDSAVSVINKKGNTSVKITKLDSFIDQHKIDKIDLLKIDTETFENYVLRGAKNTLSATRYLFIEVTIAGNNNYTVSSLFKLLCTDKYDFQLVAFRNYSDQGEGFTPIIDMLLKNTKLVK